MFQTLSNIILYLFFIKKETLYLLTFLGVMVQELDNATLRRFLHARNLDVKKASTFLLKHLKWRQSMVPNGFISEAEIQYELSQKKAFAQGFDKMGRPIAVIINARHNASKRNMHEFKCEFFQLD